MIEEISVNFWLLELNYKRLEINNFEERTCLSTDKELIKINKNKNRNKHGGVGKTTIKDRQIICIAIFYPNTFNRDLSIEYPS